MPQGDQIDQNCNQHINPIVENNIRKYHNMVARGIRTKKLITVKGGKMINMKINNINKSIKFKLKN